jgi:hypothetical protein
MVILLVACGLVNRTSVRVKGRRITHLHFVIRRRSVDIHGLAQGIEHAFLHIGRK